MLQDIQSARGLQILRSGKNSKGTQEEQIEEESAILEEGEQLASKEEEEEQVLPELKPTEEKQALPEIKPMEEQQVAVREQSEEEAKRVWRENLPLVYLTVSSNLDYSSLGGGYCILKYLCSFSQLFCKGSNWRTCILG